MARNAKGPFRIIVLSARYVVILPSRRGQVRTATNAGAGLHSGRAFLAVLHGGPPEVSFKRFHEAILSLIRYCSGITTSPR